MHRARRFLNHLHRGKAVLELIRNARLDPDPTEMVELEPGVFGQAPAEDLGLLGALDRALSLGEQAQTIIRGRHYYGAARKGR